MQGYWGVLAYLLSQITEVERTLVVRSSPPLFFLSFYLMEATPRVGNT